MGRSTSFSVSPGVLTDFPTLVASRDVKRIKAAILERYGFDVTDQYAADLLVFVEELTNVQRG